MDTIKSKQDTALNHHKSGKHIHKTITIFCHTLLLNHSEDIKAYEMDAHRISGSALSSLSQKKLVQSPKWCLVVNSGDT